MPQHQEFIDTWWKHNIHLNRQSLGNASRIRTLDVKSLSNGCAKFMNHSIQLLYWHNTYSITSVTITESRFQKPKTSNSSQLGEKWIKAFFFQAEESRAQANVWSLYFITHKKQVLKTYSISGLLLSTSTHLAGHCSVCWFSFWYSMLPLTWQVVGSALVLASN